MGKQDNLNVPNYAELSVSSVFRMTWGSLCPFYQISGPFLGEWGFNYYLALVESSNSNLKGPDAKFELMRIRVEKVWNQSLEIAISMTLNDICTRINQFKSN